MGGMYTFSIRLGSIILCRDFGFLVTATLLFALSPIWVGAAPYYDGSASSDEREYVYEYLDQIELKEAEAFGKIQGDHAVYVAKRMGYIDRDVMDAASFCSHILAAQRVRERFYKEKPLSDGQFKRYLLPLRIKHEYTRRNWLPALQNKFSPLTESAKTADEAAEIIFTWVKENLALKSQREFYQMTTGGDLDVFSVLEEREVHEISLSIFTVAALRSAGVAARIVWAPMLRGERGGKLWLEYWSESEEWVPWMPSIAKKIQEKEDLVKCLQGKVGLILVHQDDPKNVTERYFPVCELSFEIEDKDIRSQIFLLGNQGLIAIEGHASNGLGRGKVMKVARGGDFYLALAKHDVAYFLTKVNLKPEEKRLVVLLEDGKPRVLRGN